MGKRGFTLLEVIIAMLILGVGIVGIMELFPRSLYQVRIATERQPTSAWADRELGILRAWGLASGEDEAAAGNPALAWPVDLSRAVQHAMGESYVNYVIQPIGTPDWVRPYMNAWNQQKAIYYLYRVTIAVPMIDGRYEKFVTYMSKY